MKLRVIRPACARVHAALDTALTTGDLRLPPELAAHIEHCPHCADAVDRTQQLLHRMRSAAAGLPLTLLPGAVNTVLSQTQPAPAGTRRRLGTAWFLGQFAALAGMLLLLVCLLAGLVSLIIHLFGTEAQLAWQPVAQALGGSPFVSLLLERDLHLLVHYAIPPQGAVALAGAAMWWKRALALRRPAFQ